jgi:hypothetical protein
MLGSLKQFDALMTSINCICFDMRSGVIKLQTEQCILSLSVADAQKKLYTPDLMSLTQPMHTASEGHTDLNKI